MPNQYLCSAIPHHYDQGQEGACVGFGWSRCMSIFNGKEYTARWLWDAAKKRDEWPGTNPGDDNGTSVRAAAQVLKEMGHVVWDAAHADDDWQAREKYTPDSNEGLKITRHLVVAAKARRASCTASIARPRPRSIATCTCSPPRTRASLSRERSCRNGRSTAAR